MYTPYCLRLNSLLKLLCQPVSIGTANCRSLEALGTGDVKFHYVFGERQIIFTLCHCLYALSAPINLLLVGALAECGMSCLISPGGITKIFYPESHPRLLGFLLTATVVNRLSYLNLTYIPPDVTIHLTAFPAQTILPLPVYSFPRVKLDSILWHHRFGHIGMDATKATLTKNYVTGIQLDSVFVHDHCIPYIVGRAFNVHIITMVFVLRLLVVYYIWIYVDLFWSRLLTEKNISSTF